ncbi:ribosomal protein S18-alanine N-acetyltransferase [Alloalcanivorax gelatiniphagus]|uniref:[Ribosomal protein bS18]-alanine N-acetyltransferase n=1 Tax=Alloalcanivorax gelatiniphagus TaxID=1194167 RepID=A0ABY2XFT8_9GAMM|nr:ribosomal protein S18-alanine N-acetyltransferase [Alloalcanivorax gelatiniphagus]TMW10469.1 ribosomal-protein-alanine N-acetyltransferase [Alloalcanivorax gelatiniphagus]|tara:strand:- start:7204 stop:7680 length:477 start_codon:yes stop_codon:yes gene_type:complete
MIEGPGGARLRTLTSTDLDAVLTIEEASQPTPWTAGNFRDCLHSGYRCRVATVDGEPVAFMILSCVLDESHLLNIAVAPAWQRRGLARWMLRQALAEADDAGLSLMFLEVRDGNQPARRLYRELGFQETGRRKAYYRTRGEEREDAVLMMVEITGAHK